MFKVEDIFILDKKMFFDFAPVIPPMDAWWLDTPKSSLYKGHFANYRNEVYVCYHGEHTGIGIRPALKVTGLQTDKLPGDKMKLLGYGSNTWTVLSNANNTIYLLYDKVIRNDDFFFLDEEDFIITDTEWISENLKIWISNKLLEKY